MPVHPGLEAPGLRSTAGSPTYPKAGCAGHVAQTREGMGAVSPLLKLPRMKRRDFLKASAAVCGTQLLPSVWLLNHITESLPRFECINPVTRALGSYVMFAHPDITRDLMTITAKERWKAAYRQARLELRGMFGRARMQGEVGTVERFRFVLSPTLRE